MAPQPSPPPPPPESKPPAPTTIAALDDDLLREIFLRPPDLPSLACAAFTCRANLGAVRSSPAFRRRFRALYASPLLALFVTLHMRVQRVVPAFTNARRPSDPHSDLAADDTDLLGTIFRRDDDASVWSVNFSDHSNRSCRDGYFAFHNGRTWQRAYYNPQTKCLDLCRKDGIRHSRHISFSSLEFYTLFAEEDQKQPSRVICVLHDNSWSKARVAVFSSSTMEWQIFPEAATSLPPGNKRTTRTVAGGFVCWNPEGEDYIFMLNSATLQFSRVDLPPQLKGAYSSQIGQTKDGKLCIVNVEDGTLSAWIWTADHDGVERFMLGKMFPLHTAFKDIMKCSTHENVKVQIMAVIDVSVYLSMKDSVYPFKSSEWFLSFSLETGELCEFYKSEHQFICPVTPYIMEWPHSLVHKKKNSESKVAGDSGEDDGPVGTEVASSILIRALQSFREALIKDDESKIAEIDAFLTLDEKNSLVRRMTTFYAALTAVRDRILSVSADSDVYRERSAVRDRVLSVGADSDVYRERLAMRDHVLKVWRYFHAS